MSSLVICYSVVIRTVRTPTIVSRLQLQWAGRPVWAVVCVSSVGVLSRFPSTTPSATSATLGRPPLAAAVMVMVVVMVVVT